MLRRATDENDTPAPGTVRYPGFGACEICGIPVDYFVHYRNDVRAFHYGVSCSYKQGVISCA